ncbi:hypothetical protein BP5796_06630 [Coleophoma crateriformis]|uniref:Dipeptidyl-peptidase V n=1 Tax=Coleophoma crateriformis TaxID=565419 RepID=A0A3D8RP31_9HELO|nr:hypothetical protein BP5796_06630 [Coleophoma crateriformis]
MTIKSNIKLTPELLITAPRRSPAVPSPDGKYALYTVSTYSLESHTECKEVRIVDLGTDTTTLFSDNDAILAPQWLSSDKLLWLKKAEGGKTEIWIGTVGSASKNSYRAGLIDAAIQNIKIRELPDGNIALAFSALADDNGALHNVENTEKPLSSAREYDTILVRFWDAYFAKERGSLWYTVLKKTSSSTYKLSETPLVNALASTNIDFPSGVVDTDSMNGSVDLSDNGIILVSRDPAIDMSKKLTSGIWHITLSSYTEAPQKIQQIRIPGFAGLSSSPSFSQDGKKIALLMTKSEDIGADYNRIFVVTLINSVKVVVEVIPVRGQQNSKNWGLSPSSLFWSSDSTVLYVYAEERGRQKLWKIPTKNALIYSVTKTMPVVATAFPGEGSVTAAHVLSKDPSEKRLLINRSSLVDSGTFNIIDPDTNHVTPFSSVSGNALELGLKNSQVSEIIFKGDGDYDVQAWVMKPAEFDKDKKYPLAFLIHGGPAGAWGNAWSTRWNPAVWAEQGYVVVAPNPTGSTGFGYEFAAAVKGEWGGRAYGDLVKCFEYVRSNLSFVDTERAVAAGGSYGGYMVNWIAGQPLGRQFKTLICHDGIFSSPSMLSSDVPLALDEDMGSHLWDSQETWDKYNPARFTHNWKTPMLFIHSDKDYRCPVTEGLAPYTVCLMKGIPSRFLNFPDENHFVLQRENSLRWYKTVLGWANKYAGVDGVALEPALTEPSKSRRKLHH